MPAPTSHTTTTGRPLRLPRLSSRRWQPRTNTGPTSVFNVPGSTHITSGNGQEKGPNDDNAGKQKWRQKTIAVETKSARIHVNHGFSDTARPRRASSTSPRAPTSPQATAKRRPMSGSRVEGFGGPQRGVTRTSRTGLYVQHSTNAQPSS